MIRQPQTCYECGQALSERLVDRVVTVGDNQQSIRVKAWVCLNNHQFFPQASVREVDALRSQMKAGRTKATV